MALDPSSRYPGQVDTSDPDGYPYGAGQNIAVEGDGTGTPLEKDIVSDILGFQQSLLVEAGLTPSGLSDKVGASQYTTAVIILGGRRLVEHKAMREWQPVVLPFQVNPRDCHYNFLVHPGLPLVDQDVIVGVGWNAANTDYLCYARSFDGGVFDAEPVGADTTQGARCASAGADGEFLVGSDNTVVSHTQLGKVKASVALPTDFPVAVHYARFCATYLALGTNGFYAGTSLALLASNPFYAPAGFASAYVPTLGASTAEFADDGSANIVCASRVTISAVERLYIFHSADNGATWSVALTSGAGITGLNVAWNASVGKFVALDSDGNLYTSATGAAWALVAAATPITAAGDAGASTRYGTLAVAGRCIAKLINPVLYTTYKAPGVAYTFDLGASWRYQFFGYGFDWTTEYDVTEDPEPLLTLIAANDRFFATDGYRVYRSGLLSFEADSD